MNNGLKSGLLIIGIAVLGIAFFVISGKPIPVFFTRFLVVGILISFAGFVTRNKSNNDSDNEDTGRRLR